ncbi:MAG: glycerophosphodiester phosphodiesterase [Acidobacteriota bacterium]
MARGPRTPKPGPLIIGHRGFAACFPDNSLAGVRAALAAGADGVEVDVRPCAEGAWVCHHDRTRRRRPIEAWPLDRLRRAGVPLLDEVVAAVPEGRWVYVEVKPLAADRLAAHVHELAGVLAGCRARVRVISSSLTVLAEVEDALGAIPTSLVFGELPEWLPGDLDFSPKHTLVEDLIPLRRPLHPWTVNRRSRMIELVDLGVASITTNRPDLAVEALRG